MMFSYLGSGSRGNCLAIWAGTPPVGVLVDVGLSATQIAARMRKRDIDPAWFQAFLVGQGHGDHTDGLEGWLKRHPTTTIYATQQTGDRLLALTYSPIALRETRSIGPFTVSTVPVWHDNIAGAAVDDGTGAVTFMVEHGGRKLALLYESGRITFEMMAAAQGAQAVLIEANHDQQMLASGPYSTALIERVSAAHLSNRQAGEYLATLGPETQIVLACHRSLKNNDPNLVRSTLQAALDNVGSTARLELAEQDSPTQVFEILEG